jgi:hypothetical protein
MRSTPERENTISYMRQSEISLANRNEKTTAQSGKNEFSLGKLIFLQ